MWTLTPGTQPLSAGQRNPRTAGRYAQYKGQGFTGAWMFRLDYSDVSAVSDWADEAMHWMVMNEIIKGMDDGTLNPQGDATRAQVATMLMPCAGLAS